MATLEEPQSARRSSISPKAESFVSRGTYHTDHHLMGKQEFEEVELDQNVNRQEPVNGTIDYTTDPKFKLCFLGLWYVLSGPENKCPFIAFQLISACWQHVHLLVRPGSVHHHLGRPAAVERV
jgi:hypothetical protein